MASLPAVNVEGAVLISGLGSKGRDEEEEKYGIEIVSRPKGRVTQMDENIWRLLPEHLIGIVLSWLPVVSIVKAQLVCKSWNSMINSRFFSDRYSEACLSYERDPWLLVFPKKRENVGLAYDPLENKWMSLSFGFLPTESSAVATAEGLICMIPKANNINGLYICNPITKLWRELPRPQFSFSIGGLVVERNLRSFKIVLAGSELVPGNVDQYVLVAEVYDSQSNSWMRTRSFSVEAPVYPWRTISHGVLYCVIGQTPWNIVGFDVKTASWFRVRASMPTSLTSVKLMDHKGRLIMIGGLGNSGVTKDIGIWELTGGGAEWTKVGGLPREFCDEFLRSLYRRFACVGHGNLIYFTSKKCPHMLVYDLARQIWRRMLCFPELAYPHLHILNGFCFEPRRSILDL